ncbi:cytoplasmic protein [Paludibaculum fermentans]|uniref:cytoplasmic protein n=1 Tax=Paludibaculum fermentans TaxID=1473598 RepID=UPI003EC12937
MSKRRSTELDALLDKILTDAHGDEEQLWALLNALEENVKVPCAASFAGESVKAAKFDYDGNARRGITATIRRPDDARHVVAAADILLADASSHRYIAAYRQWMGVAPLTPGPQRAQKSEAPGAEMPAGDIDVVVLSLSARAARCRMLHSGEMITLRAARLWQVVPGEIATIEPHKQWTYGSKPYLSGKIKSTRLDAKALGLTPLRIEACGDWDPKEEYWGEPGEPVEAWAKKIIKRGRRPQFEMEQVIPGEDPHECSDPIIDSNDLKEAGDYSGACDILMGLCRADLRCLDAHTHLGNLSFDTRPKDAIRNYEVGVRIGELSLPAGFDGVLPWGLIDNRPFLRCLNGYGLCLWRLKRFDESLAVFDRMLWLNPSDNQGVRFVIDDVRKRHPWEPDVE